MLGGLAYCRGLDLKMVVLYQWQITWTVFRPGICAEVERTGLDENRKMCVLQLK